MFGFNFRKGCLPDNKSQKIILYMKFRFQVSLLKTDGVSVFIKSEDNEAWLMEDYELLTADLIELLYPKNFLH